MLFEAFTDEDFGPNKAGILVVDLLVCDMDFLKAFAVIPKDVTDVFVNYLISSFLRFSQYNKMVTALKIFGFLLVFRGRWYR